MIHDEGSDGRTRQCLCDYTHVKMSIWNFCDLYNSVNEDEKLEDWPFVEYNVRGKILWGGLSLRTTKPCKDHHFDVWVESSPLE